MKTKDLRNKPDSIVGSQETRDKQMKKNNNKNVI